MTEKPNSITQSNSGHMGGGMQAAIGENNSQAMSVKGDSQDEKISQADVGKLLLELEKVIEGASLLTPIKEDILTHIKTARLELEEESADKQFISKSLGRAFKSIEKVDKSMSAGERIIDKTVPILAKILPWLGTVAASLQAFLA